MIVLNSPAGIIVLLTGALSFVGVIIMSIVLELNRNKHR